MKLNAKQIIKALECHASENLAKDALALIKELTEDNKAKDIINLCLIDTIVSLHKDVRADTVREFAEKVIALFPCDKQFTTISRATIDQIAQEMLEVE